MRVGATSSEINHPSFLLVEHRGAPITLKDLALIADSLPKRGPLNKWQQAVSFVGGILVLAACAPAPEPTPTPTTVHPSSTETPHIYPTATATAFHPTPIEITPSPFVSQITPEVISIADASLPPAYVAGNFDLLSLPEEITQIAVSRNSLVGKELSAHHLVPIKDSYIAAYETADKHSYGAIVGEIFDKATNQVLKPTNVDEQGIVSYTSEDGLITQYFPSRMPCEEGKDCFTVVSFDKSDSSVTYWVQVDTETGKLEKYMPAIYPSQTKLIEALKTGLKPIEKGKWDATLHGAAALAQAGEVMGVSYEAGDGAATQGGLIFMVTENDKNVVEQVTDKNIAWNDGVLSAKNENGTFVWVDEKSEWKQIIPDQNIQDDAPIYKAGDARFILVDDNLQEVTVESMDGKSTIIMQDGSKQVWDGAKWVEEMPMTEADVTNFYQGKYNGENGVVFDAANIVFNKEKIVIMTAKDYEDIKALEVNRPIVIFEKNKITISVDPIVAADAAKDRGAAILVGKLGNDKSVMLKVSLAVANKQYEDGNTDIRIVVDEIQQKLWYTDTIGLYLKGWVTHPEIMPLPKSKYIEVGHYNQPGMWTLEEAGIDLDGLTDENWVEEILAAGYDNVLIFSQAPATPILQP